MSLQEIAPKRPILRRKQVDHERRLHRRVACSIGARGLTGQGVEFEAQTIDICAGGIRMITDKDLQVGDTLVLYIREIGRVEGAVIRRLEENHFAVVIQAPRRKREKIADQLTWLINRDQLQLEEERSAERRAGSGQVIVSFGTNMKIACSVIDMSLFGVALRTNGPRPQLGVDVSVGDRAGRCVRFFDGGFAVDFRKHSTPPSPS